MADGEKFMQCTDPRAGDCSIEIKKCFLALINQSVKRVPALRPSSEEVSQQRIILLTLNDKRLGVGPCRH